MKRCSKCQETKPIDDFYKDRGCPRSECKTCTKQSVYARRLANPEKARGGVRAYYAAHRAEMKEYQRTYRETHVEELREYRRRTNKNAKTAEYRRRFPEKHRERQKRRRARHAGVPYESVDFAAVLVLHGPTCWLCDEPIDLSLERQTHRLALTFDHVVPLSLGGPHCASNLRPAHRSCNSARSNRMRAAVKR